MRYLIKRLEGQYANQKLCLAAMNAMAARQGGKLWGDNSKKNPSEEPSSKSTLLSAAGLQKPIEMLIGKDGVALVKEYLPKKEELGAEIKSFVKDPTASVAKVCRLAERVLGSKMPE